MSFIDKLKHALRDVGHSEGKEPGPEPGDGAVVHHSSGNADFDGLPGDVLPPRKGEPEDQVAPQKRAAD
jgi:hypothetical protein